MKVAGMHRNTQYASMFMTCVFVLYGYILFLMYPGRTRPKICLSFSKVVAVGLRPHRNTGASTGIDRNTGESRRNAPEYTVCVNVYDVCVCSVWLYFVFNVSRTN